jgi:hypothetical protein
MTLAFVNTVMKLLVAQKAGESDCVGDLNPQTEHGGGTSASSHKCRDVTKMALEEENCRRVVWYVAAFRIFRVEQNYTEDGVSTTVVIYGLNWLTTGTSGHKL